MNKRFILPLLALLVFLTFALYWNLFVTNQATVAARLLINILTPLNSLLILILVFLLSRTLIKLYLEHRGKKAGFRLRTKLVLSILPLTLVPGLMMLLFSYQLPEQIISNLNLGAESDQFYAASRKLSDAYLHDVSSLLASHGPSIENLLTSGNVPNKLDQYIQTHRLDGVEIYQDGTLRWRSIARGLKPLADRIESSARYFTVPGPNPARWEDGFYLWRFPYNHNEWTLHFLFAKPEDFSANLVYLNNSLDAYAILERKKDDVANLYQSTLLVGTFAVIFGGIWMGMTFSRTFLKAFNTLSEGARKVESGELDTKIDLQTGDEIEEVGHAFNNMTQALQRNQAELNQQAKNLQAVNIQLQSQMHYTQTLLRQIGAGILSCDQETRIRTVNPAARQFLGLAEDENQTLKSILTEKGLNQLNKGLSAILQGGTAPFSAQIEIPQSSADPLQVHCTIVPLRDEEHPGALLVLEDLTSLLNAQKVAAWREVAQRVAHEIKNPLTPIQLSVQRIQRKAASGSADLGEAVQSAAETILSETNILKNLVNEFSTFAKMPAPQKQEVDLANLLRTWFESTREVHGDRSLTLEVPEQVCPAWVDPSQIRQVLTNLVNNAVQASQNQEPIAVLLRETDERQWTIQVSDEGSGIPPEEWDAVFLPYYSKSPKGTGLGLAIVKRIIEDHGGTIRVQANQPKGTQMQFTLPR